MMSNINSIEDSGSSYEAKLSSAVSSMNTQVTNLKNKISSGMNLSGDIVQKITQCYNLQNQFISDVNTNIKKLGYTSTVSTTEQVSTALGSLKTSWNSVITAINNKLGTSISTSSNLNPSSIVTAINNANPSPGTITIKTIGGSINWMGYIDGSDDIYNIRAGRTYTLPYGTILSAKQNGLYENGVVDFYGDFWYVIPDDTSCTFNYTNSANTGQGTTIGYGLWSLFSDITM